MFWKTFCELKIDAQKCLSNLQILQNKQTKRSLVLIDKSWTQSQQDEDSDLLYEVFTILQ